MKSKINEKERRIAKKSSRTAAFTCVSRAASYHETSPNYKSEDDIAPLLLPRFLQPLIKSSKIRTFLLNKLGPKGIYEYVIARTKIIDQIFTNALLKDFDQILLFGAGFDTRGIRLTNKNPSKKINIFELDVKTTLNDKLKQYKKRGIDSGDIIFVEIDFNTDILAEKLKKSGFKYNKKTLYILEGVTMYLNKDSIDEDFQFIYNSAGIGSEVVFDYIFQSVLDQGNLYYGEQEIYQRVKKDGEGWTFGIEKGEIDRFLEKYHLKIIEHMEASDLEDIYFSDAKRDVKIKQKYYLGKVNGTHCIVYARIDVPI